jgi:hypothetical protein
MSNKTDPLEAEIQQALAMTDIAYVRESKESKFLDFYLPEYGVHLEVKGGSTPRIADQCERDHNVIVIQGMKSAKFIFKLLDAVRRCEDAESMRMDRDLLD